MNGIAAPRFASHPYEDLDIDAVAAPQPRSRVSVVMVVFMTGTALRESVQHVLGEPLVDEFVIVDNGSTETDAAWLRSLGAREDRVTLLAGHGNVGFARGANLGAARSRGDVLVFLNPDAFLQPGCIAALVNEAQAHPAPCLVGGRVLNADLTEQRGARRGDITLVNALMSLSTLARRVPGGRRYEVHWESDAVPEAAVAAPTISGACFCMRRADFESLRGFDEKYFLHVEDVDLCWRVRQAGGAVLFHPKAEVIHLGHTSQTSPLAVEFHKGVGLARYFRKRAQGVWQRLAAVLLSPVIVATAVARPMVWRLKSRAS